MPLFTTNLNFVAAAAESKPGLASELKSVLALRDDKGLDETVDAMVGAIDNYVAELFGEVFTKLDVQLNTHIHPGIGTPPIVP